MQQTKMKAIVALICVALGYSLLSVVARLMDKGLGPMTQVYLRIGLGFLLALVAFRKNLRFETLKTIPQRDWGILIFMGTIAYSVAVYFVTMGALKANLLNVSVVYSTIGFFVYIYSLIFLRNKFNPLIVLLISLSFLGIIFVSGKSFLPKFGALGIGEFYVLISAAFMGFTSIGRKLLSKHLNNHEITVLIMAIGCISGFIIALAKGEALPDFGVLSASVAIGLVLGALLNITSNFFESYAFEHLDVVLGNQILLFESLFSMIIGGIFYGEMVTIPEIVGSLLILGSVYWSNKAIE